MMKLYKLRMLMKHNKFVYTIYCKLNQRRWNKNADIAKKALAEQGMQVVEEIEKALAGQNVKYFLSFGNLLGLEREGHFIKYDNDIDYSIFIDENFTWEKLEQCMSEAGYRKIRQFSLGGEISEQTYKKGILPVDFFGCRIEGDYTVSHDFFRMDDYTYTSKEEMHVLEGRFAKVDEVKKKMYGQVKITVPADPIKYLESVYTEKWTEPDPNWCERTAPGRRVLEEMGSKDLYLA